MLQLCWQSWKCFRLNVEEKWKLEKGQQKARWSFSLIITNLKVSYVPHVSYDPIYPIVFLWAFFVGILSTLPTHVHYIHLFLFQRKCPRRKRSADILQINALPRGTVPGVCYLQSRHAQRCSRIKWLAGYGVKSGLRAIMTWQLSAAN